MDNYPILREIFPNKSENTIKEMIGLAQEQNPGDPNDLLLENIINLLTESGDSTFDSSTVSDNEYEAAYDDENEGAVGYDYQQMNASIIGNNLDRIYNHLIEVLPKADPDYLREKADIFCNQPENCVTDFIDNALENNDYPTREDYVKRTKERNEFNRYTRNFNVNEYLQIIPNPIEKYSNQDRKLVLTGSNINEDDINYVKIFLYNKFRFARKKYIDDVFDPNINLINICKRLDRLPQSLKKCRPLETNGYTANVELLQLLAYIQYGKYIKDTIRTMDAVYQEAKKQAIDCGLIEECIVCSDQLIPEECFFCRKGCVYCKDCLRTGTEVGIGNGDLKFPCHYCDQQFSLWTLKMVLSANIYEKLEQRIQNEEIKNAMLDDSDSCPFCGHVQVFTETNKIFKCQNEECAQESCRLCKHVSHIPLRCNEIEYDEDVQRRTFIENQMAEAVMRTCVSCNKKFVKENGCNKMVCSCGAKMCYICGSAIVDYSHFGTGKCPLHTDDLKRFHLENVRKGAREAKQQLNGQEIKFDPEENLEAFFN
ncbi:unnamed protein product [Brassicogethes aeneus]|uniref:RING-type domain-containing protein n=1 Tax=Brassicogethes aeneus TaxID=1431903 RepID=A0A9P0FCZ7_BRAAE|nr:unnamed protein product [Brassicogethes aeneus]